MPLASLGLSGGQLTTSNSADDAMTLSAPFPLDAASLIAPFQRVIFRDDDDAVRFCGWLDQAPRVAAGNEESWSCQLTGPFRWLDRTNYSQGTGGIVSVGGESAFEGGQTARLLRLTIKDILDAAVSGSGNAFAYLSTDLDDAVFNFQTPLERRVDNTCGTALRAVMRFVPTVSMWWEYSVAGDIITPVLRLAASDKPEADHTVSEVGLELARADLNPRYDLLFDVVKVYFLQDGEIARTDTAASAGDAHTLGAARTAVYTFDASTIYNVPEAGLAARLARHLQRLHIDTEITIPEIDWSHIPGQLWGYAGAVAEFSSYTSFCFQIVRDLFGQMETIQIGVPPEFAIVPLGSRGDISNGPVNSGSEGRGEDPGGSEPETGALTVVINKDDEALSVEDCHWTAHGPATYQGAGDSVIDVEVGAYVVIFHPVFKVSEGLMFWSDSQIKLTIGSGAGGTAYGSYSPVHRFNLKFSGIIDPTGIDLNAQDIVDMGVPEGKALLKVRKDDCVHMGQPGYELNIGGDSWPQEL